MPERRPLSILLVTQFAPPAGFSATRRTAGLAKYLTRLGHRVTVLTSLASGRGEMPEASKVIRTRDLIVSRVNWRRGHFESVRGDGAGAGYADRPSRLAAVVVPDLALVAWAPFALARAAGEVRAGKVDCVITTSPPESAHLIGLALKRRFRMPWIADLQDGWTFESTHPDWPLSGQTRLDSALEAAVTRNADLVTTVTDPLSEDLRRRTGARVMTLTNGFDPEEHVPADKQSTGLRGDRFSLVYTGRLAFARSTPEPLLGGLRLLCRNRPDLAARLEVVFAGPLTAEERNMMQEPDVRDHIRMVGNLERRDALALQRAADALLLVIPPARPRSVATAKLYEYMAAGRPILVLGEDNAAADTVRNAGMGAVTSGDDPDRIAGAIAELMDGGGAPEEAVPADVERFGYPSIARALADVVDDLCAGRG